MALADLETASRAAERAERRAAGTRDDRERERAAAERRAWLVSDGTTAQDAAAEIHTDMARGFIRADVVRGEALVEAGSVAAARERGALRSEGRDYRVRDGDVITFRF